VSAAIKPLRWRLTVEVRDATGLHVEHGRWRELDSGADRARVARHVLLSVDGMFGEPVTRTIDSAHRD